jgi:small basic protein
VIVLIPLVALIIGILLPRLLAIEAVGSDVLGMYLAVACVAGLDSVCGGIRTGLEGKFNNEVFLSGFFSNMLIAFFLAWLGDRIGINLYLVAVIVLGMRVFTNLSLIRRILLTKWHDERERRRLERQSQAQQTAQ